jgi:hypothetical protein
MPVAIGRGRLISSRLYPDCPLAHEQGNSMKQHRLAAAVALVGLVLAGCDAQTSSVELKTPAQKASYGIGLNMGKSLAQEGMDDLDSKQSPKVSKTPLARKNSA